MASNQPQTQPQVQSQPAHEMDHFQADKDVPAPSYEAAVGDASKGQNGHPAPQQGMQYAPPSMVVPLDRLTDTPEPIDCPYCQRQTKTVVNKDASGMTILTGVLLGLCCICLACVPCCMDLFADTTWTCGTCHKKVAFKTDSGQIEVFGPQRQMPSQYGGGQVQAPQNAYLQPSKMGPGGNEGEYQPPQAVQQPQQEHGYVQQQQTGGVQMRSEGDEIQAHGVEQAQPFAHEMPPSKS